MHGTSCIERRSAIKLQLCLSMTTQHTAPPVPAQQTLALINANIASSVRLLNDFSVTTERRLAEVCPVHPVDTLATTLSMSSQAARKLTSPVHIFARSPAKDDARRSRSESLKRNWHLRIPRHRDRKATLGTAGI